MITPQEFYFKQYNGAKIYQILSNGKKVVIWFRHVSGREINREVIYL
jgi:hypothetical protein